MVSMAANGRYDITQNAGTNAKNTLNKELVKQPLQRQSMILHLEISQYWNSQKKRNAL